MDPQGLAEKAVDAAPKLSRTLYFCPSPLYGYGLEWLLSQTGADSAVLGVEADEELMALSLAFLPEGLRENPRFRLVRTGSAEALCGYVRRVWGPRRFRRVVELRLTGGWQFGETSYRELAEALRRDIAIDWGNAMTLVKLGRRYIRNAIMNLPLLSRVPTVAALDFGNAPALVLGAGPSLDGVLEGLGDLLAAPRDEKRTFRLICVDTALLALRARGIEPNLVVALESQHWNLRDFVGLGDWNIPVAMDLSALPATREVLGGQSFLFVSPWAPLRFFSRLEEHGLLPPALPPLGSVGLTAVALACRIGTGPLITGGLDFSFSLDRFHARSTPGSLANLRDHHRLRGIIRGGAAFRPGVFTAPAKNGETLRSDPALRGYRDLFEREFASEKRLVDITGPGLPLGIPAVSLAEARRLLAGSGTAPAGTSGGGESPGPAGEVAKKQGPLAAFLDRERETLLRLRRILTGAAAPLPGETDRLLDEADYLWAHFPDCAGAGGRRPPAEDLSFLKRVRVELDPFINLYDRALEESQQRAQ
jgi:hypothetical protein